MLNNSLWIGLCLAVGCGDQDHVAPDAAPSPTFTARIRGPLASSLADSQSRHDGVAAQGKAQANAAGDFAHQVGLGTTDLGTHLDEFLALDRWTDASGAQAFYADPNFQAELGPLFSAAPSVDLYERRPDWAGWGQLDAGRLDAQPYWFVVIEGRLASTDRETNHAAHDAIASRAEAQARAAGDLAHLPHLAVGDDRTFFNVDVWNNEQGMLATFTSPDFQAAFGSLFESPPDIRVYRSTDWYQW